MCQPKTWLDLEGWSCARGAVVRDSSCGWKTRRGVTVNGGVFAAGQWGVLVDGARDVTLRGGRYEGLDPAEWCFTTPWVPSWPTLSLRG